MALTPPRLDRRHINISGPNSAIRSQQAGDGDRMKPDWIVAVAVAVVVVLMVFDMS
jgi:hypothetical protein